MGFKTGIDKVCVCGKPFYASKWKLDRGQGIYCGMSCYDANKGGRTPWNKGKKTGIIPKTAFKKGEHFNRATEFKKGQPSVNFKGDKVGYFALHNWIKRKKGKATLCIQCSSTKNVQWANKSFEYKRDLDDWLELCAKCHRAYDWKNGWGRARQRFPEMAR